MREREEQTRRQITIQPRHNVEVTVPIPKVEEWVPKRTHLRNHVEFARYGFTDECPGCESAQAGTKNRAHSERCRKRVEEKMEDDRDHKRRLIDTKKRKEKYYEENDKKKRKEEDQAEYAETKRNREEQCEGQELKEQEEEEPEAKRLKEEPQQEDEDMGCKDEAEKDINQMEFWEVYNAEADNSLAHGEEQPEDTMFWDDNSGKQLDPKLVKRAREEEMQQFQNHVVYEKAPIAEATNSGTKLITTRWVGTNKGGDESPKYRCRLVTRGLNAHDETGLFAATPPLEGKKVLFSMAMTNNETQEVLFKTAEFFLYYLESLCICSNRIKL